VNNYSILDKKVRQEDRKVIVTKTMEERLTRNDLLVLKEQFGRQKQQIIYRFQEIKKQHELITAQEKELDSLLAMLPEEKIEL
jgi:hypothetical protein